MGGAGIQQPGAMRMPSSADATKARINALAYADVQRKMRQSQGRQGQFLTTGAGARVPLGRNALLGQ